MEPVGIAASLIAVVTCGLQCIKFIHQTTSGIKNGPNAVQRVATASQNLWQFLEQIDDLAEQARETLAGKDPRFFQELQPLLRECVSRLSHIKEKLQRFPARSGDRLWSRVKIYLREKDFEEMWNVLNHYIQLLGSQLARMDIRLGLLNSEDLQVVGEVVTKVSREAGTRHEATISAFDQQHTKMDELRTSLCQQLGPLSDRVQETLIMSSKQASEQEMTRVQLERIFQALQLGQQENNCNWQRFRHFTGLDVEPSGSVCLGENGSSSTEFPKTFDRISGLATIKEKELFTSEAQSIISDLARVIDSIVEDESSLNSRKEEMEGLSSRKQRATEEASLHRVKDILRAARGLFIEHSDLKVLKRPWSNKLTFSRSGTTKDDSSLKNFADSTRIFQFPNDVGALQVPESNLRRRRMRQGYVSYDHWPSVTSPGSQDSCFLAEFEPSQTRDVTEYYTLWRKGIAGSVVVEAVKSATSHREKHAVVPTGCEEFSKEHFSARIKLTPSSITGSKVQIILDLSQEFTKKGNILLTPLLSFRSIIPYNSEVFNIVQFEPISSLRKALAEKSASLTDCDPDGRSLLNYAMHASRPSMVRFLVEAGADTNSFERSMWGVDDDLSPPLEWAARICRHSTPLQNYLSLKCCEALLANDADPSMKMHCNYYSLTVITFTLAYITTAMTEKFLDLGAPFISPNSLGEDEEHPLIVLAEHHASMFPYSFDAPSKFVLFLTRGANVNDRDSYGRNCLHLVMETSTNMKGLDSYHEPIYHEELRDILTLMITAGADVTAIDDFDKSVSDRARENNHENLWKNVLDFCGYDAETVCSGDNDINHGWSSGVNDSYEKYSAHRAPKLSFKAYLAMRNTGNQVTEIFDLEEAEARHAQILRARHARILLARRARISADLDENKSDDSADTDMYESDDAEEIDEGEDETDDSENHIERPGYETCGGLTYRDECKFD